MLRYFLNSSVSLMSIWCVLFSVKWEVTKQRKSISLSLYQACGMFRHRFLHPRVPQYWIITKSFNLSNCVHPSSVIKISPVTSPKEKNNPKIPMESPKLQITKAFLNNKSLRKFEAPYKDSKTAQSHCNENNSGCHGLPYVLGFAMN